MALLEKKDQRQHFAFVESLVPTSFTLPILERLLNEFGPLQIVVDRATNKSISLVRRILSSCLISYHAHSAVERARTIVSSVDIVAKISQSLAIDKRMYVPHPAWTNKHDAILIMSIEKHGWIENDACCRAITEDKTIQWGYPFDIQSTEIKSVRSSETESMLMKKVAKRAAQFLLTERETLESIKDFKNTIIVDTYRLKLSLTSSSEDIRVWEADEVSFSEKNIRDDYEMDLPTKKDLVRRAKALLQKPIHLSSNPVKPKAEEKVANEFCILDQKNMCNVFIAEILRVLTKVSFNNSGKRRQLGRRLMNAAANEARKRKEDSFQIGDTTTANSMQKMIDHCAFANRFVQTQPVQAKNVIRAILKIPLVTPKNGTNQLFPPECVVLPIDSIDQRVGKDDRKEEKNDWIPHRRDEGATGDKAISDAMFNVTIDAKTVARLLNDTSYIQLSAPETLLLTVICSQGLPTWTGNWRGLIHMEELVREEQGPGFENAITFWGMGEVFEAAASVWHHTALQKLERNQSLFKVQFGNIPDSNNGKKTARSKLERLEEDEHRKRICLATSRDYKNHPRKLAKKCIMLLESVRKHAGPLESLVGKNGATITEIKKSENLLGSAVLGWLSEEIERWAKSLEVVDISGYPLSYIAADFAPNQCQGKELHSAAALMEQTGCRAVFGQVAQQSRVRKIFLTSKRDEMNQLLIKAVDKFIDDGEWADQPSWWGQDTKSSGFSIQHDYFVLESLLAFGYGGIENTILDLAAQQGFKDNSKAVLTRGAIQRRANQLTRTLDIIDRTQRAVTEILKETRLKQSSFIKSTESLCSNKNSGVVDEVSKYQVNKGENQVETTCVPTPMEVDKTQNITDVSVDGLPVVIDKVCNLDSNIDSKDVRMAVENVESIIDADIKETSASTPMMKNKLIVLDDIAKHTSNTIDLTGED
mmetsp:Transcript_16027/g.18513  ORF Transcript_16027/g.18513 Transcript_16027/m.18513 type:complete len:932 (+) Transcript_16027:119-2914(+)